MLFRHLLVEGGEVQGEAEPDGVARRESNRVGGVVLWLDLLEGDWPGSTVMIVIGGHFYEEIIELTKKSLLENVLLLRGVAK
jgi:hypothetical protein